VPCDCAADHAIVCCWKLTVRVVFPPDEYNCSMSSLQQQIFSKAGLSSTVPTGCMRPTETFGLQLHDLIITYGSNKMKCKRIADVNCYSIMLVCTAVSNTNHRTNGCVYKRFILCGVSEKQRNSTHCKLSNATIHFSVAATTLTGSCPYILHVDYCYGGYCVTVRSAGLEPMLPMQLHWAPRLPHHGVWAGCSFFYRCNLRLRIQWKRLLNLIVNLQWTSLEKGWISSNLII